MSTFGSDGRLERAQAALKGRADRRRDDKLTILVPVVFADGRIHEESGEVAG